MPSNPVFSKPFAVPMVRFLYSVVLYLLAPMLFCKLTVRIFKDKKYLDRLVQRFGYGLASLEATEQSQEALRVWIHAVSVGEVNAAVPLVKKIKENFPDSAIILTTMTPTGAVQANNALAGDIRHCYLAYDYPGSVQRFLRTIQPSIAIFMETEIWPNYLAACGKKQIPTILANSRLSEKSYRGYRHFRRLIASSLSRVDEIAAQAQMDAGRLLNLGAKNDAMHITGNIKFDLVVSDDIKQRALTLRSRLGTQRPIWIAGSTHSSEEAKVLEAHAEIKRGCPAVLLILVPRHPERAAEVCKLCARNDLQTIFLSELNGDLAKDADIVIGDKIGQLPMLISSSDVAFIGGSLVPVGGHNILEACAVSVPVIFGPHMFNFQKIADQVLARGAGLQVDDQGELAETASKLLNDPTLRQRYGSAGKRFVEDNQGAVERIYKLVEKHLLRVAASQ